MKVTFQFNTYGENFDQTELNRHLYANKMATCLMEVADKLKGWYKYDSRELIPADEVNDVLWDIINKHINLEEIGY